MRAGGGVCRGRPSREHRAILDGEGVTTGCQQPVPGPVAQVTARGRFDRRQKLGEGSVAKSLVPQVVRDTTDEDLVSHERDELPQRGGTLGIRDPVEVRQGVLGRQCRRPRDGVGGRCALRGIPPGFAKDAEVDPGVGEFGCAGEHPVREVFRERLVEPQVVPPLHGDQVAEPHVGHLVTDGPRAAQHLVGRGRPSIEQRIAQRHAPRVLHGDRVEVRDEHLVIVAEGIPDPEERVIGVERLLGHLEDLWRPALQLGTHRCPRVQAQRDPVVRIPHGDEGTATHGEQIGRDRRRGRELPLTVTDLRRSAVADDDPVRRSVHPQADRGLEVGLVEAGEHRRRIVEERLHIDIGLPVGRVDRPVQPRPVTPVGHRRVDAQRVGASGQRRQRESPVVPPRKVDRYAVQQHLVNVGRLDVDPGLHPVGQSLEGHRRLRRETFVADVEIQRHGIPLHGQLRSATCRFGAGERRHTRESATRHPGPPGT